jgi:hypothetical protein
MNNETRHNHRHWHESITPKCKMKAMEQIQNLLRSALKSKPKIDWGKLVAEYPLPKPTYPNPVVCP